MVLAVFKLEVNRVLFNKRSIVFLLCLLIVTLYLVHTGMGEYNSFLKNKDVFLDYEKAKVGRYLTYDQYGGYGFRLLYQPSPLMVFFTNSGLFNSIMSNSDVKEIMEVNDVIKGRALFDTGMYKDFAGMIFLFGSLYFLLMGVGNFGSRRFIDYTTGSGRMLLSSLFRLLLLLMAFALIFLLNYLWASLGGISFSPLEAKVFMGFFFYAAVFLIFFYCLGLLIGSICKTKKTAVCLAVWFILIFIIPELMRAHIFVNSKQIPPNESLNFKKFETLMDKEKVFHSGKFKDMNFNEDPQRVWKPLAMKYWKEVYSANLEREKAFNERVAHMIDVVKARSVVCPCLYFPFLATEISSRGYSGYAGFIDYIMEIRDGFMKFYIEKRYLSDDNRIEPFIKGEENVFKAEGRIPGNFWGGLVLTLLYALILLGVSQLLWTMRLKRVPEVTDKPDLPLEKGTSHFVLCPNADHRDKLFRVFSSGPDVVGLDRVTAADIDTEVCPRRAIQYLSAIRGVEESAVRQNLEILGVAAADLKASKPPAQLLKKIYAAVIMAAEANIYVVNDFLKGETKDFEQGLYAIFSAIKEQGGMVVYLSDQFFSTISERGEKIWQQLTGSYKPLPLSLEEFSVR
jgi:hypothetical protein